MPVVALVGALVAGHLHLLGVDDDHVVAHVHVRREGRLVLAAQHAWRRRRRAGRARRPRRRSAPTSCRCRPVAAEKVFICRFPCQVRSRARPPGPIPNGALSDRDSLTRVNRQWAGICPSISAYYNYGINIPHCVRVRSPRSPRSSSGPCRRRRGRATTWSAAPDARRVRGDETDDERRRRRRQEVRHRRPIARLPGGAASLVARRRLSLLASAGGRGGREGEARRWRDPEHGLASAPRTRSRSTWRSGWAPRALLLVRGAPRPAVPPASALVGRADRRLLPGLRLAARAPRRPRLARGGGAHRPRARRRRRPDDGAALEPDPLARARSPQRSAPGSTHLPPPPKVIVELPVVGRRSTRPGAQPRRTSRPSSAATAGR